MLKDNNLPIRDNNLPIADNNLPAPFAEYVPLLKHYSRLHECAWNYYANSTTTHKTARKELHAALFDAATYTPVEEKLRETLAASIELNEKLLSDLNTIKNFTIYPVEGALENAVKNFKDIATKAVEYGLKRGVSDGK